MTMMSVRGVLTQLTRRRYGRQTYTWAEFEINGKWVSAGDPWPCLTPPKRELEAALMGILHPDDNPFQLIQEPASRQVARRPENVQATQTKLFSGLDCLPDQQDLFQTDGRE